MAKEKLYKKIQTKHIKDVLGIIIILISIFGLINYTYASTAITYAFAFIFGNLYFLVYALLIYVGFVLIFGRLTKKLHLGFVIIASIFLLLALLMALSFSVGEQELSTAISGKDLRLHNFSQDFLNQLKYNGTEPTNVFTIDIGGGFMGCFLVAFFNTIFNSHYGTIAIMILFLLISFAFYLYYPFKMLFVYFKEGNSEKIKKFKDPKKVIVEEPAPQVVEINKNVVDEDLDFIEELKETAKPVPAPVVETKKVEQPEQAPVSHVNHQVEAGFSKPSFNFFDSLNTSTNEIQQEEVPSTKVEEEYNNYSNSYEDEYEDSYENNSYYEEETVEEVVEPVSKPAISFEQEEDKKDIVKLVKPAPTPAPAAYAQTVTKKAPAPDNRMYKKYKAPSVDLLKDRALDEETILRNKQDNDEKLQNINKIFEELGIGAKATGYIVGPSVTRFDIFPNKDVSISTVEKYINDISSRLGGIAARFEKIVQGKTSSALEIANVKSETIGYKTGFKNFPKAKEGVDTYIPFGRDINGKDVGGYLAKFPHMLISGSSGSGKSIYMHSVIMSLIMRNTPDNLKFLLIDPKEVELSKYDGIPHLLCPCIGDAQKAKIALDRLVVEMDSRYKALKEVGASDLPEYNEIAKMEGLPYLPTIIVIIDEYADLIEVEKGISSPVQRIAQKARAAGIHMIIATQRPSVNVLTGVIKSNITVRCALMASSNTDSRVVLDQGGAENLVGNGDMLVQCASLVKNALVRVQAYYLDNIEIKYVVKYLKENYDQHFDPNFMNLTLIDELAANRSNNDEIVHTTSDPLYPEIREYAYNQEYASVSQIQRNFNVGFNRAGKLMNLLLRDGICSTTDKIPSRGNRVLITSEEEYLDKLADEGREEY